MNDFVKAINETGATLNRSDFVFLSEAAKLQVADNILTEMFKFITDKYNALDFDEIEKSAGDIRKFKYRNLIMENAETLGNIYQSSDDAGANKYKEVIQAIYAVYDHLEKNRDAYATMYKRGNGVIQLMYTSLVAATIYGTSALVTNTIRFVTTEIDSDMEVVFDEIPGSLRQVHIRNLLVFAKDVQSYDKIVSTLYSETRSHINETIDFVGPIAIGVILGTVIFLIPKLITLLREVIYSIYYSRVKLSDMLNLQVQLIRTNIESLEAGRGNKKIIARQRKIADRLETIKNRLAVKLDMAGSLSKVQQQKENKTMNIDRNSPLMQTTPVDSGLMI